MAGPDKDTKAPGRRSKAERARKLYERVASLIATGVANDVTIVAHCGAQDLTFSTVAKPRVERTGGTPAGTQAPGGTQG